MIALLLFFFALCLFCVSFFSLRWRRFNLLFFYLLFYFRWYGWSEHRQGFAYASLVVTAVYCLAWTLRFHSFFFFPSLLDVWLFLHFGVVVNAAWDMLFLFFIFCSQIKLFSFVFPCLWLCGVVEMVSITNNFLFIFLLFPDTDSSLTLALSLFDVKRASCSYSEGRWTTTTYFLLIGVVHHVHRHTHIHTHSHRC